MIQFSCRGRMFVLCVTPLLAAIAGCVAYEPPKYDDAALGGGRALASSGSAPSAGRIGLVVNANTERSLQDSKKIHESLGSFVLVNTAAQQDIDPTYLHARLIAALKRRYPSVDVAKDLSSSIAAGHASTAVVDVRTRPGKVSGDKSTVEINIVFFDRARRPTARLVGSGVGTIPYPAWDFGLQSAADQAVEQIAAKL